MDGRIKPRKGEYLLVGIKVPPVTELGKEGSGCLCGDSSYRGEDGEFFLLYRCAELYQHPRYVIASLFQMEQGFDLARQDQFLGGTGGGDRCLCEIDDLRVVHG